MHTLWGEIAYQIGGIEGYSLLRDSDEQKVSPGTDVIEKLIKKEPTVIILDEIAQYLRRAKAITVGKSDLSEQVVAFLFALMDSTAACNNMVFVYTLASISDTFGAETSDLKEALQTSARQARVISPSTDIEIYNIVKQRILANKQELDRAVDIAREHLAIQNILKSPNRQQDLSENQRKQMRERGGEKDLATRVALTNAYRHLFYPTNDPMKAPKGLLHFTLPAEATGDVKGNKKQQDVILKVLKDCQKIRSEDAAPFAPAYILQKVWLAGIDHWTTKALREEFAKNLGLNMLLDADIPKLRETIRRGIQERQWDLKVGNNVYIRADDGNLPSLPDPIEFSDRMELYRRRILKSPEPRVIELNAQVMPSSEVAKPVRLRWRSQGALTVRLYQDGVPIAGEFLPSGDYATPILQTTSFKIVADYGNGETAEKETQAVITSYSNASVTSSITNGHEAATIFEVKPETIEESGTVNASFTAFSDRCSDYKVKGIQTIEIAVDQVMDYRKITTAFPLLGKFNFEIDQKATIQIDEQFVRLDYQGSLRGFQSFLTPVNALLGNRPLAN